MNLTAIRAVLGAWITVVTGLKVYWLARPQNWQGQAWVEARINAIRGVGRDTLTYTPSYTQKQILQFAPELDYGRLAVVLTKGATSRTYEWEGTHGGLPAEAGELASLVNLDVLGWGMAGSGEFMFLDMGDGTCKLMSADLADDWTYSGLSLITAIDLTDTVGYSTQQGLRDFTLEIQVWSHTHADGKDALHYTELLRGSTLRYYETFLDADLGVGEVLAAQMFDRPIAGRDASMAQLDISFHSVLGPTPSAAPKTWIETVDMYGDAPPHGVIIDGEVP